MQLDNMISILPEKNYTRPNSRIPILITNGVEYSYNGSPILDIQRSLTPSSLPFLPTLSSSPSVSRTPSRSTSTFSNSSQSLPSPFPDDSTQIWNKKKNKTEDVQDHPGTGEQTTPTKDSELWPDTKIENIDLSDDSDSDENTDINEQFYGERFYLSSCRKCKVAPIKQVVKNLRNNKLNIRFRTLSPQDIKPLVVTLMYNPYITTLDLRGNRLGPKGFGYISDLLKENNFLNELDISENSPGLQGMQALSAGLCQNNTIKKLHLSGNDMGHTEARILSDIIKNDTLEMIDLSHNDFSIKSARLLGVAIVSCNKLTNLDLSWNKFRLEGATIICKVLEYNESLKKINLRFNGLALAGCKALEIALARNQTLVDLDISHNRIETTGFTHLVNGLSQNNTLEILKLGNNPISPALSYTIIEAVSNNPESALRDMDLTHVSVDVRFGEEVTKLKRTRSFQVKHDIIYQHEMPPLRSEKLYHTEDPLMLLIQYVSAKNFRLIDLFHSFDEDKSMSVSRDEFAKGLVNAGINIPQGVLDQVMDRLDSDGDGEIDFQELTKGYGKVKRQLLKKSLSLKNEGRYGDGMNSAKSIRNRMSSAFHEESYERLLTVPQSSTKMTLRV